MTPQPGTILFVAALAALASGPLSAQTDAAKNAPAKSAAAAPAKKPGDNTLQLADDAPTMYTVVKGDTLWDISAKFLKEPWRWPEIWGMNREQIKDPHWIYPGDLISLAFDAQGRPFLSVNRKKGDEAVTGPTVKLSPRSRPQNLDQAIPSIPARVIAPFLNAPLVAEQGLLQTAPRIVATEDHRLSIGAGNIAYAAGITTSQGVRWQVYRQGRPLVDPVSKEVLGYEAVHVGDAKVTRFGEAPDTASALEIVKSLQEIGKGDRLSPAADPTLPSYAPHAPDKAVKGHIVSLTGESVESAQYSIVVLNMGRREGMEVGHVLAVMRESSTVNTASDDSNNSSRFTWGSLIPDSWRRGEDGLPAKMKLPEERNGLLVVFRVFDRVSYALVMSSKFPIRAGDVVQSP